jgi:hypothetical protein
MKMIDEMRGAARANPLRFTAWVLVFVVLIAGGFTIGESLGYQLYVYTH